MRPGSLTLFIAVLSWVFSLSSCSREDMPFTYSYLGRDRVEIRYQGKTYLLKQGMPSSVPFVYRFESDGDLDITIAGRSYEIESPFDIDKPLKKVKKLVKSKKTVRR